MFKTKTMEENQYNQQNFTLPHDIIQLPTGGIFYKSKKKSIKVGYLTASDENILLGGTNQDNIVMSLLRNKIYEPDLKPEDLLPSDVEAILIFLRTSAFGPEYVFNLTDPKTGKQFESTVLIDELNLKQTKIKPDNDGLFTTVLPKSGVEVKLKPLNMGDVQELDKLADSYPVGRVVPKQTWKLVKMIDSINGNPDKGEISKFVESMPIMDSKYIKKFMDENEPGLDLRKKVRTPSGEELTMNIVFGVEFFRPFF